MINLRVLSDCLTTRRDDCRTVCNAQGHRDLYEQEHSRKPRTGKIQPLRPNLTHDISTGAEENDRQAADSENDSSGRFSREPMRICLLVQIPRDNESTPIYDSFEPVASDRSGHIDHAQSLAALKLTQYFRGLKRSAAAGLFADPICINNFLC